MDKISKFKELIAQWYTPEQAKTEVNKPPVNESNFRDPIVNQATETIQDVWQGLSEAWSAVYKWAKWVYDAYTEPEITPMSAMDLRTKINMQTAWYINPLLQERNFKALGSLAQAGSDVLWAGVKTIAKWALTQQQEMWVKWAIWDVWKTVAPYVAPVVQEYWKFKQQNPLSASYLENAGSIWWFALDVAWWWVAKKPLQEWVEQVARQWAKQFSAASDLIGSTTKQVWEGIQSVTTPLFKWVSNIWNKANKLLWVEKKSFDDLVWSVIQWKTSDIWPATRTIENLWLKPEELKNIKYADLSKRIDDARAPIAQEQDAIASNYKWLLSPENTKTVKKVWNKEVSENFIQKSLDQLEDLYTQTSSLEDIARIQNTKELLASWKMTMNDAVNLAREYWSMKKWFTAAGDAMKSAQWVWYENVRKWMKDFIRDTIWDPRFKELDSKYSDLMSTKWNIDKAVEWVNKIRQKMLDEWAGAKLVRMLDEAAQYASLGWRWKIKWMFAASGVGKKTLDRHWIEQQLEKSLKKIIKEWESKKTLFKKEEI